MSNIAEACSAPSIEKGLGKPMKQVKDDEMLPSSTSAAAKATAIPPGFRAVGVKITPWKLDISKCFVCACKFTIFNHRHRCRSCQEPVCHPCSRTRKVLRAYTPPKRVCDICVGKFWTPKAGGAAADVAHTEKNIPTTDKPCLSLNLTDSEGYSLDAPTTAPISPSTPMVDGGFFGGGAGSSNNDQGRQLLDLPLQSPAVVVLPSTPEEEEGTVESMVPGVAGEGGQSAPVLPLLTPSERGATGGFFGGEEIKQCEQNDKENKEDDGDVVAADQQQRKVNADAEAEADIPSALSLERVSEPGTIGQLHVPEGQVEVEDEEDEEQVRMPVDASVFLFALMSAALPSVLQSSSEDQAVGNNASEKNAVGGDVEDVRMYSFAAGLGWGLVAAGVGFGVAMLVRRW